MTNLWSSRHVRRFDIIVGRFNDFITIDDKAAAEYSQNTLEEVEAANNDVEPTKMSGTLQIRHETYEENSEDEEELGFQSLKPILMKSVNFNAQLCSPKAVAGAGEHYEELKATCEKF